jgi:hypothetical protein
MLSILVCCLTISVFAVVVNCDYDFFF